MTDIDIAKMQFNKVFEINLNNFFEGLNLVCCQNFWFFKNFFAL